MEEVTASSTLIYSFLGILAILIIGWLWANKDDKN